MKRKAISFLCFLLIAIFVLSSCNVSSSETSEESTKETTETEEQQELSPDDIVYEDEEMPAVYISTSNNFQVTSKTEYTNCIVRIKLNERYSEYTSTYTDINGGGAQIRYRSY